MVLTWTETAPGVWRAETEAGVYQIEHRALNCFWVKFAFDAEGHWHSNFSYAKETAQADHARRMKEDGR
jgi:hypothetical protein